MTKGREEENLETTKETKEEATCLCDYAVLCLHEFLLFILRGFKSETFESFIHKLRRFSYFLFSTHTVNKLEMIELELKSQLKSQTQEVLFLTSTVC